MIWFESLNWYPLNTFECIEWHLCEGTESCAIGTQWDRWDWWDTYILFLNYWHMITCPLDCCFGLNFAMCGDFELYVDELLEEWRRVYILDYCMLEDKHGLGVGEFDKSNFVYIYSYIPSLIYSLIVLNWWFLSCFIVGVILMDLDQICAKSEQNGLIYLKTSVWAWRNKEDGLWLGLTCKTPIFGRTLLFLVGRIFFLFLDAIGFYQTYFY